MGDIKVPLPNLGAVLTGVVAVEIDNVCGAFLWHMLCALPVGGWVGCFSNSGKRKNGVGPLQGSIIYIQSLLLK